MFRSDGSKCWRTRSVVLLAMHLYRKRMLHLYPPLPRAHCGVHVDGCTNKKQCDPQRATQQRRCTVVSLVARSIADEQVTVRCMRLRPGQRLCATCANAEIRLRRLQEQNRRERVEAVAEEREHALPTMCTPCTCAQCTWAHRARTVATQCAPMGLHMLSWLR